jgi:DMSO/TMAO reductase YedYZ molybdopterin-dependent catalytic subunit
MNRRYFLAVVSSGLLAPEARPAQHHVTSADPLEVEFDLNSLRGRYTPVEDFYVRNHYDVPADSGQSTLRPLRIDGEVEHARELSLADFASMPEREVGAVLECAGNRVGSSGLISNGSWAGCKLQDVLALVRPSSGAAHLHLLGRDGYKRSVRLERATAHGILVTRLNGRPLTRQHGAPWRALFPGWFGMDSVKWLDRLVVARDPLPPEGDTYQEIRQTPSGTVERHPLPRLPVKSVIIDPLAGVVLRRGGVEIRGLAWSGTGKIASVEVSPDGGTTWRAAELLPGRDFEWWLWKAALEFAQPGTVEFVARARDSEGSQQPAQRDPSRLDGYANNWYHRVRCVVV